MVTCYNLSLTQNHDCAFSSCADCVPNGGIYSLRKAQLEMMLDSLYPSTGNSLPFTTILTPNQGTDMYVDETNDIRAYQIMLITHASSRVDHIWANYAPCPTCVRVLISHFDKETEKPVVHVARITDFTNRVNVDTLKCLARLKREGFDIQAFNFNEFKSRSPPFNESCNSLITTYYQSSTFNLATETLQSHVTFIEQIGGNTHASTWCT